MTTLKDVIKHLQGKHPQSSHAPKGSGSSSLSRPIPQRPEGSLARQSPGRFQARDWDKDYKKRVETVGPRSKGTNYVEVPKGVKLSDNFRREGLHTYGRAGTKASISGNDVTSYTLRSDAGSGPVAFAKRRESLQELASNLEWEL